MTETKKVSKIPAEPKEISIEMRRKVTIKKGDKLLFSPTIEALAGEHGYFFQEHSGKVATVLGFGEDGILSFFESVSPATKDAEKEYNRFWVEFEDGFRPEHSIYYIHFVVP